MSVLFIGDIVGQSGLEFLERHLPELLSRHEPTFVIANAENLSITGRNPVSGCGMATRDLERLFRLGIDAVTGGNHSWDGPAAEEVHCDERVLRPLNYGAKAPGRGTLVLRKNGSKLGAVNLASRTALPYVDQPHDVLERQLQEWDGEVDAVLVDFHGESVSEKQIFAWSFSGRIAAVLGTHTHVATMDSRILPGGTAFVTDVGMTGPSGGMQGYDPELFLEVIRTRLPSRKEGKLASGPVELGAVLVHLEDGKASAIERLETPKGVTA